MLEIMTGSLLKKITEPGLEINPEVFQKLVALDGQPMIILVIQSQSHKLLP